MSGDKITSVVKNRSGKPIGTMVFREDGSFSGRMFGTTSFVETFGETVKSGFASGIILYPELIPAQPKGFPCDMRFGIDGLKRLLHGMAFARFTGPTRVHTNLCKSCLDYWLDNADDDDCLEPLELLFFEKEAA